MSENNPTQQYSKPPIKEAVFDLQTRYEKAFDQKLFDAFFKKIPEYSNYEPLKHININTDDMTKKDETIGYRCISKDKKQIVQFKKDGFSFSRLEIYDGWDKSYKETLKLWGKYCEAVEPEAITRVATRFINKFKIPHVFTKPEEYFKMYIQYNKDISRVWNQMSHRVLLSHTHGITSHIVFDSIVNKSNQFVDVLLDIDVFSDNLGLSPSKHSILENTFNQLRKIKNDIFEKSITDKVRQMIQ